MIVDRGKADSEKPLRPYYSWALYIPIGLFFLYRGIATQHTLMIVCASVGIAVGTIMFIVNVVERLRPWRKVIACVLVSLCLLAMTVRWGMDMHKWAAN